MTRVRELMAADLNVSFGHDCVMDPWYSMGSGDMLEVADMAIHVAQMAGIEDECKIFDAITVNSAKTMGLEGYGLDVGCKDGFSSCCRRRMSPNGTSRLKPNRLFVIGGGGARLSPEPRRASASFSSPGRPASIDVGRDDVPPVSAALIPNRWSETAELLRK